ncbi:cytochrome c3 family protein [Desulfogranum mediterraneum]|uniref:cytochrome c3 family protein n=1 Tax=Desulfogranum mediterraneum TaxID=160661 RepID=UPI00041F2E7A|nr:cytochrome c3 family protein [Desulfogranum mediterraneum]
MKKLLVCGITLGLICMAGVGFSLATDKGAADMTLQATIDKAKKAKPAIFPHGAHQERLACADCHHSKDAAGKRVAYVDGQKIEKCETCHNKQETMPKKLADYKGAAHALCKDCHKATDKKLAKCSVCHPKKK